MNRETTEYVSRRMERDRNRSPMNEYPEYETGRISRRYTPTGTYRMENHMPSEEKEKHQIGFTSKHENKKEKDFIYEMEESLENEIDDVVYYSELAMEAEMKGHIEFSNGFYEIAKEKLACAEFIRLRLIKHGEYDPSKQSEIEERYDRAKHLFRRL